MINIHVVGNDVNVQRNNVKWMKLFIVQQHKKKNV